MVPGPRLVGINILDAHRKGVLNTPDMETNSLRRLSITFGLALLAVGGQPLVNYLSGDTSLHSVYPSLLTCGVGLVLIVGGFFWRPQVNVGSRFTQTLLRWSNSPISYSLILLLVWVYFETLAIQHNIQLAQVRNDQQSIAVVVDRLVLPRRLTQNQQQTISNFLSQFGSHEYAFRLVKNDEEAGTFRADIEQALIKGGWTRAATNPYVYTDDVPEGLSINFTQTMQNSQKPPDVRSPNASQLLEEAFGVAGVRLNQTGGGSGINVTEDRLEIGIGLPRRDTYEYTAPQE